MKKTIPTLRTAIALGAILLAGNLRAAPLRIGVTPGSLADSVQVAAAEARQAESAVRKQIRESFAGDERLYSLPWLSK